MISNLLNLLIGTSSIQKRMNFIHVIFKNKNLIRTNSFFLVRNLIIEVISKKIVYFFLLLQKRRSKPNLFET